MFGVSAIFANSARTFIRIGLLLVVCLSPVALAVPVAELYRVVVDVDQQNTVALKRASADGLATLFVRLCGSEQCLQSADLRSQFPQAQRYLQQYRYQQDNDREPAQLQLVLDFDPTLVKQRLRFAGQPLWAEDRPALLVWLAIDRGNGRELATFEVAPEMLSSARQQAQRRGLPLSLPLMDLEDNIALSAEQVWQLDAVKARRAAQRYQADAVLIGHATRLSNGQWLGSWVLLGQGSDLRFSGQAGSAAEYAAAAIDQVAERLASIYAVAPVSIDGDGLLMSLQGISDFNAYARALQYLQNLTSVRDANVLQLRDDWLLVQLDAEGELVQLQQALARGGKLRPTEPAAAMPVAADLHYRWAEGER